MNNEYSIWLCHSSYLSHHGIPNMHWGERHGPPYPLSSSVSKAIQSGRIVSGKPGSKSSGKIDKDDPHGKKVTAKDKIKAHINPILAALGSAGLSAGASLAMGAALPVAAIAGAGGGAMGLGRAAIKEAKNLFAKHKEKKVKDIISKSDTDKKTGLKLKDGETTIKEDIKMVNPAYGDLYKNSKHNCALCSLTYDMRRRGYNVTAQKAKTGYSDDDIAGMYKNGKMNHITYENGLTGVSKTSKKIMNDLKSQGVGARGVVTVTWKNGGGHAMAYEVTSNGPIIIDAQSGKQYKNPMEIVSRSVNYMSVLRTDKLTPNYDIMKKEAITS